MQWIFLATLVASSLADGEWVLGGGGKTCTFVCQNHGGRCDEAENLSNLLGFSTDDMKAIVKANGGNCNKVTTAWGKSLGVPNYGKKHKMCHMTLNSRKLNTIDCNHAPSHNTKSRICWCTSVIPTDKCFEENMKLGGPKIKTYTKVQSAVGCRSYCRMKWEDGCKYYTYEVSSKKCNLFSEHFVTKETKSNMISGNVDCGCVANSEEACRQAAIGQGTKLGGGGYNFVGDYPQKGCYFYGADHENYPNMAYYSTGGTDAEKSAPLALPKYRPTGSDCEEACIDVPPPTNWANPTCSKQVTKTSQCALRRSGALPDRFCHKACGVCGSCEGVDCNGGVCMLGWCACVNGFTGPRCTIKMDEADEEFFLHTGGKKTCPAKSQKVDDEAMCSRAAVQLGKTYIPGGELGTEDLCYWCGGCSTPSMRLNSGYESVARLVCVRNILDECLYDCGENGTCKSGSCECEDGWKGEACDIDMCDTLDCGKHGKCEKGKCVCDEGHLGTTCNIDMSCTEKADYFGSTIRKVPNFPSAEACQRMCLLTADCLYFTYNLNNNNCFLKSSNSDRRPMSGAISGPPQCGGDAYWRTVEASKACARESNGEFLKLGPFTNKGVVQCKERCESEEGCIAIDFFRTSNWCNTLSKSCTDFPATNDGSSHHILVKPDPCYAVKCGTNGSCNLGVCLCDKGFAGDECEIEICDTLACGTNGICRKGECVCLNRWSGPLCDIDPCSAVDCGTNGECNRGVCLCDDGFSGERCQIEVCDTLACGTNGVCSKGKCVCQNRWSGALCDIDPCVDVECGTNGECNLGVCLCDDGFSGDRCQVDSCANVDCGTNGVCMLGLCDCTGGYTGLKCEIDPDPCANVDCGLHGDCALGLCGCKGNFTGERCQTDTCANVDCGNHGKCGLGVCTCSGGFTGTKCEIDTCADVDCKNNGKCRNGVCVCGKGFSGDFCETNKCAGVECGSNGKCMGGTCKCKKGFSGDKCQTEDLTVEKYIWSEKRSEGYCGLKSNAVSINKGRVLDVKKCKTICEGLENCVAIDYFHDIGYCNVFSTNCSKPSRTKHRASNYVLERKNVPKPKPPTVAPTPSLEACRAFKKKTDCLAKNNSVRGACHWNRKVGKLQKTWDRNERLGKPNDGPRPTSCSPFRGCSDYSMRTDCISEGKKRGVHCAWGGVGKVKSCRDLTCEDYNSPNQCNNMDKLSCQWNPTLKMCRSAEVDAKCDRLDKRHLCENKKLTTRIGLACQWHVEENKCMDAGIPCNSYKKKLACTGHFECGWKNRKCVDADQIPVKTRDKSDECNGFSKLNCTKRFSHKCTWSVRDGLCYHDP